MTAKGVALPGAPEPSTVVFTVRGPIAYADLPGLCERVCGVLAESDAELVLCEVGALVEADAVTVDAVARLQLAARRHGRRVRLRHASRDLQELLAFVGLGEVVPSEPPLRSGFDLSRRLDRSCQTGPAEAGGVTGEARDPSLRQRKRSRGPAP